MGLDDPFQKDKPKDRLTAYIVDAVAGSGKTHDAVKLSAEKARRGENTLICMPTLELIREWEGKAREWYPGVYIESITSEDEVPGKVATRILSRMDTVTDGCILFVTHTAVFDLVPTWPDRAKDFHFICDEVPEVLLTQKPFKLPANHWLLRNFIKVVAVPTTIAERKKQSKAPVEFSEFEEKRLASLVKKNDKSAARFNLEAKKASWDRWKNGGGAGTTYYRVLPVLDDKSHDDPLHWLKLKVEMREDDDIYLYLDPLPARLLRDAISHDTPMFTSKVAFDKLTDKDVPGTNYRRGTITFIGFRRPDILKAFKSVTIMSALFNDSMAYDIWKEFVNFVPSPEIKKTDKLTNLGKRKLRLYYMTDERWTKYLRNRAGISEIFKLIKKSGVIGENDKVCVVVNKDIATEDNPKRVTDHFRKAIVMPHNSQGQNRFDGYHKMIHLAAFNPYTTDIKWIDEAWGIDSEKQHINRTCQTIYQTVNRTSIRDPNSTEDVVAIISERFVAEWIAKKYTPRRQVIIKKLPTNVGDMFEKKQGKGGGRKPIGDKAMTEAEKKRRQRALAKNKNVP